MSLCSLLGQRRLIERVSEISATSPGGSALFKQIISCRLKHIKMAFLFYKGVQSSTILVTLEREIMHNKRKSAKKYYPSRKNLGEGNHLKRIKISLHKLN